ncbi:AraC family transcriptional regulator [Lachnospiraceae bacterium 54-53]
MKELVFRGKCDGVGISHVSRDCDLTEVFGFYKNEYQIQYILDGERFFYSGNKSYRMSKGTLSFIDKKKIPFTNIIGGKYHERVLIEIQEKWLVSAGSVMELDLTEFFSNYHGVIQMDVRQQEMIEKKIKKMEDALREKKPHSPAEVKKLLLSIFIMILNGAGTRAVEYGMLKGKMMRYVKVSEIIYYIMEHYSEIYGLEDLANIFYLDKSYLSRIFKEVTNFTVNEFINCQRIDHARIFLQDESLSMEEISKKLGYERLSYFDRVFKKHVGISPLQYRKSIKTT